MKEIKLSNKYIFEGYVINENSIINLLNEEDDHFNNFNTNHDGNLVTNEELQIEVDKIIDQLIKEDLISVDNSIQIQKDIFDFCKMNFARYAEIPSIEIIKNYIIGRNQSFATV